MVTDHFPKVSETFFVAAVPRPARSRLGRARRLPAIQPRALGVLPRAARHGWATASGLHVARDGVEARHRGAGARPRALRLRRARRRPHAPGRGDRLPGGRQLPRLRPEQLPARPGRCLRRRLALGRHGAHASAGRCGSAPSSAAARRTGRTSSSPTRWTWQQLQPPPRPVRVVGTHERPLRLLSVGRLHWKKGHELALGRGGDGSQPRHRAGLPDRGRGRAPRADRVRDQRPRPRRLRAAARAHSTPRPCASSWRGPTCCVHPSLTEAFGVAVAEAQAMGLPVVCSDVGGLPENIEHGVTGLAVPRRDPAALADAIARLATDHGLRHDMGLSARHRAETELDHQRQLDRFEQLYRELLSEPAAVGVLPLREARAAHRRRAGGGAARAVVQVQQDDDDLRESSGGGRWSSWCTATSRPSCPRDARVLVVSRGDEEIVDFAHHRGEHFPQAEDGRYAGHHPADSAEAIAHLDQLRESGAGYLVIPGTAQWWLEHYGEFAQHLDQRYQRAGRRGPRLHRLQPGRAGGGGGVSRDRARIPNRRPERTRRQPAHGRVLRHHWLCLSMPRSVSTRETPRFGSRS